MVFTRATYAEVTANDAAVAGLVAAFGPVDEASDGIDLLVEAALKAAQTYAQAQAAAQAAAQADAQAKADAQAAAQAVERATRAAYDLGVAQGNASTAAAARAEAQAKAIAHVAVQAAAQAEARECSLAFATSMTQEAAQFIGKVAACAEKNPYTQLVPVQAIVRAVGRLQPADPRLGPACSRAAANAKVEAEASASAGADALAATNAAAAALAASQAALKAEADEREAAQVAARGKVRSALKARDAAQVHERARKGASEAAQAYEGKKIKGSGDLQKSLANTLESNAYDSKEARRSTVAAKLSKYLAALGILCPNDDDTSPESNAYFNALQKYIMELATHGLKWTCVKLLSDPADHKHALSPRHVARIAQIIVDRFTVFDLEEGEVCDGGVIQD
jgi:hypothetical protein